MDSQTEKTALVTGANKGIGLEIARQLGRQGVRVVLGARDEERGRQAVALLRAEGLDAHPLPLDVTDEDSVRRAFEMLDAGHGRLDILVNNAGISDPQDGPPSGAAAGAVRRSLETNFLGALAVTQAALPLLRRAPSGRIVNLSSSLGSLAMNGDPDSAYYPVRLIGYGASKAALDLLTIQLAQELRDTAILVNAVCPGYVATDLNGHTGPVSVQDAARLPVRFALLPDGGGSGGFFDAAGTVRW